MDNRLERTLERIIEIKGESYQITQGGPGRKND